MVVAWTFPRARLALRDDPAPSLLSSSLSLPACQTQKNITCYSTSQEDGNSVLKVGVDVLCNILVKKVSPNYCSDQSSLQSTQRLKQFHVEEISMPEIKELKISESDK